MEKMGDRVKRKRLIRRIKKTEEQENRRENEGRRVQLKRHADGKQMMK